MGWARARAAGDGEREAREMRMRWAGERGGCGVQFELMGGYVAAAA